jgi:hypothetical protein
MREKSGNVVCTSKEGGGGSRVAQKGEVLRRMLENKGELSMDTRL